ncbi:DUF2330 domain-containing protein [Streptomyces sp. NPDC093568]|uniref:DUF2330 domain-containing protein n=1 Tax=Streptomyces sp. NPDC093568 TaxID=3366041 RepID=UPI0037F51D3D
MHLTFRADEPVYPMRLSRLAGTPQSVGLYVRAAHRMEPVSRIGGERPRVTYAGRVTARTGPPAELADGTPFLTAVGQELPYPGRSSADHVLRRTRADDTFRRVIDEDRLRTVASAKSISAAPVRAEVLRDGGGAHRTPRPPTRPRHRQGTAESTMLEIRAGIGQRDYAP